MSSKRDWTEELPKLFEGYTEAEPEGLWEAVEAASGASARRRRFGLWWYAGGAMLAAAAVVAAVVLFRPAADPSVIQVSAGRSVAESVAAESAPAEGIGSETVSLRSTPPIEDDGPLPLSMPRVAAVTDPTPSADTVEPKVAPVEPEPAPEKLESVPVETKPWIEPRRRQRVRVQAGVSGSGLLAQAVTASGTGIGNAASAAIGAIPGIQTKSISGGSTTFDPSIIGRNKPGISYSNHRQSARVFAGVKVDFLPRWGAETGICLTTLNSSFQTSTGNTVQSSEREMQYIGIPLYLHFNALKWRSLSLYLAAGPMYEFMNSTSENISIRLNGKLVNSAIDDSLIPDRRWSANAAAGLQLEFMAHNALFVQPGFSYHFRNSSALTSYYTEKPASFSLTVGYRLILF